jgi:hypothetical protein
VKEVLRDCEKKVAMETSRQARAWFQGNDSLSVVTDVDTLIYSLPRATRSIQT